MKPRMVCEQCPCVADRKHGNPLRLDQIGAVLLNNTLSSCRSRQLDVSGLQARFKQLTGWDHV